MPLHHCTPPLVFAVPASSLGFPLESRSRFFTFTSSTATLSGRVSEVDEPMRPLSSYACGLGRPSKGGCSKVALGQSACEQGGAQGVESTGCVAAHVGDAAAGMW